MKFNLGVIVAGMVMVLISCNDLKNDEWKIADNPLLTKWAADINPSNPWPEYPRPYMERDHWRNLNGLWDYAITRADSIPGKWDGKILVPYPVESALSGVKRMVDVEKLLWYRRKFKVPSSWKDKRVMLNFEASDWRTSIWIDGKEAGVHQGGYDPFTFDITEYAAPGRSHELMVSVWDPTEKGNNPRGKQVSDPHGIWYTPVTGLWQSVWLEPVELIHFSSFRTTTNIETGEITVRPRIVNLKDDLDILLSVKKDGEIIAEETSHDPEEVIVQLPEYELWEPGNPVLYELELTLVSGDRILDQITSYAGFRKVSLGKDEDGFTRILLNDRFLFQNGPLDQGFWPDGIYTPPTEEAMISDLEMIRSMGFNMLRKHVKVENRRFYYWCDRMGLMVWQDMPSGDRYIGSNDPDIRKRRRDRAQFYFELSRLIETKYNHPSIITWVPFNEGWGQFETARVTDFIHSLDTTRLVNSASGWSDRGTGDMHDIHHYPDPRCPEPEEGRAIVLGEFGGLGYPVQDHTWEDQNWGYRKMEGKDELLSLYESYYDRVHRMASEQGLSASVYTQITDVETETNGLLTYDRSVDKMGYDNVARANRGMTPPRLITDSLVFTDIFYAELDISREGATIVYTTDGSEPGINSAKYEFPFEITESTTLKVKAFWSDGESRTKSYEIKKKPTASSTGTGTNSP